jgi:L,D-transpeptidase catalytic domain
MTVTVNGEQLYDWPVSTGRRGYDTPSGNFKPFRMEIDHYSEEWDNAPMPYSIFFTKTGDAVHGTYEQRNLGHAMSHGCVRLSVKNAATLWKLVKGEKMANTTVVLSGAIPDAGPPAVARSKPLPLTTDDQRYHALPQDQRPYNDGPPQLPFPFFFGR